MPRGKRLTVTDDPPESKSKKSPTPSPRGIRKKTLPEPIIEEPLPPEPTESEISALIISHKGGSCFPQLQSLLISSSKPRRLISSALSTIFSIIASSPGLYPWGKSLIESISSEVLEPINQSREAIFFPSKESEKKLIKYLDSAVSSMLVCVFSITNNNMANALRAARNRGVSLRIISDDEMMKYTWSDIKQLHEEGCAVRVDLNKKAHMHHKFVVIDNSLVITGSYNWTRIATSKNSENLLIISDASLASSYTSEFDSLWAAFEPSLKSLPTPS